MTTGGADASQQTGGVGINFVTRAGTNRFRGSGRYYDTNERSRPTTSPTRSRCSAPARARRSRTSTTTASKSAARSCASKLWFWGSYGKQDIKVGVVNFYQPTPECQTMKAVPAADPLAPVVDERSARTASRPTDDAQQLQLEDHLVAVQEQHVQLPEHLGREGPERPRRLRHAAARDHLSAEARWRASSGRSDGTSVRRRSGRRAISTSSPIAGCSTCSASHLGNNFVLDFQEAGLAAVQPTLRHRDGRLGALVQRVGVRPPDDEPRPHDELLPAGVRSAATMRSRSDIATARRSEHSEAHRGGNADAISACLASARRHQADLWRDSIVDYELDTKRASTCRTPTPLTG